MLYTLIIFAIAIGIAISVDSIESVFNYVGAISANTIGFVYPTLFYLTQINKKNKPKNINYVLSFVVFGFCVSMGLFSMVSNSFVEYEK